MLSSGGDDEVADSGVVGATILGSAEYTEEEVELCSHPRIDGSSKGIKGGTAIFLNSLFVHELV